MSQAIEGQESASAPGRREDAGEDTGAAGPRWEVLEERRKPYADLVALRAPDFEGPITRLWLEGNEAGEVVGLIAENAAGKRVHVHYRYPPVVASTCPLTEACPRVLH